MRYYTTKLALGALALGCFAVSPLSATAITGNANIGGSTSGDTVTVTASTATFGSTFTGSPGTPAGAFAGLTGGTYNQTTISGVGPVNVSPFMTFSGGVATPVIFDLTTIMAGFGSAANCTATESTVGAECTPAGSPFTLIQSAANTVTVDLTLLGNAFTGTAASGTSFTTSLYTTQIVPGTIGSILTQLAQPGGSITSSYSASFSATAVPEPASMLILGAGLLGIGLISRRRGSKS